MPDLYGIPSRQLLDQLERHEGFRPLPYLCPANRVTIGYGTNLEAHPEYLDDDSIRQKVETGRLRAGSLLRLLLDSGLKWTRERARAAMLDEVVSCREQLFLRCRQFRRNFRHHLAHQPAAQVEHRRGLGIGDSVRLADIPGANQSNTNLFHHDPHSAPRRLLA